MAFEQVTPVVPQGTFSVTMRKVPLVVLLPPQWSWGGERWNVGQAPDLTAPGAGEGAAYLG